MKNSIVSLALLISRIGFGVLMAAGHGWPKLMLLLDGKGSNFADPLGIGPVATLILAIITEFLGSIFLILGLFTRFSAAALLLTMLVAAFIVHASDPLFPIFIEGGLSAFKEYALLYAIGFATLLIAGGGHYSLDQIMKNRRSH